MKLFIEMEERQCRICSDLSDGAHFGIDSCRACAAFFRRSIVMKKKYVCRQGREQCAINKSVRCMCRKCRFRKCLESGMLPESVQNRRDPIIPRRSEPDSIPIASLHLDSSSESRLMQGPLKFPSEGRSENSQSPNIKSQDLPHFLYKINNSYKQLCCERKRAELSMNISSLKGIFEPATLWQNLVIGNTQKTSQIYRAQLPLIVEFVSRTFEEFSELSQDDKWIIFHSFVITLWGMDSAYRTYKVLSPEQCITKKIITETTYIDLDNIDAFFSNGPTSELSREHLSNLMRNCIRRTQTSVIDKMRELQITDEEFAALLSLSLWNTNLSNGNEKINTLAKRMRTKIFHELHLLYRYENLDEYAGRIGELMTLLCSIQYDTSRMKEDMELFNLLDVFSQDSFLYDIIKG